MLPGVQRRVLVLAVDGVQVLDAAGPLEVFHATGRYAAGVVTPGGAPVRASNGLVLGGGAGLDDAPLDTLVVAGGQGARAAVDDPALVGWVRDASARARRTCSVCTGAFLLAAAGVLDGRRATTHWAWCDALARAHPAVRVDPEPIFVRDGAVWTSAGVTAGMDLALALVEDDLGPAAARPGAPQQRRVVKPPPGGQAQLSAGLAGQAAVRAPLRELQAWMADHLDADLSVAALAARAGFTERSFARAFRREVGLTPAAYVEALRVERARLALEGGAGVEAAARAAGFGTVETLRRAFARHLDCSPSDYRDRFRGAA
jgi:transcriptional regulator GlxA family with amidase domain